MKTVYRYNLRSARGDVKRYMNGQSNKEEAAGTVYNASLPL